MWLWYNSDKSLIYGDILIWWNIKIGMSFKKTWQKTLCCRSEWDRTFLNDLRLKLDIKFPPPKKIESSGKYLENWYWLLIFNEGQFSSILLNKNEVVIPLIK